MAENKNMELKDDVMENAVGGVMDGNCDVVSITGIVFVNPYPDDADKEDIFQQAHSDGYMVYAVQGERIAVAGPGLPHFDVGELVLINRIRGYYGWEIEGVADGPLVG